MACGRLSAPEAGGLRLASRKSSSSRADPLESTLSLLREKRVPDSICRRATATPDKATSGSFALASDLTAWNADLTR